jgi:hypothetical protein
MIRTRPLTVIMRFLTIMVANASAWPLVARALALASGSNDFK